MKLKEIYAKISKPVISYEVFPPKTAEELQTGLLSELKILEKYNPSFVSLTCSAGGKKDENSLFALEFLKDNFDFQFMPHFTCICNSKENVENHLRLIKSFGIENILALRGDEPEDRDVCYQDFRFANELVEFIKNKTDFSIAVAGYPEGHIDSHDLKTDIENLKRKVDAGADAIFTQLFFDNDKFYDFTDRVRKSGISVPIVAGIMPVISFKQVEKMTKLAKITIPNKLCKYIEKYQNNNYDMREMGIEYAIHQCEGLMKNEVEGLHFYTLNRAYSTNLILKEIL